MRPPDPTPRAAARPCPELPAGPPASPPPGGPVWSVRPAELVAPDDRAARRRLAAEAAADTTRRPGEGLIMAGGSWDD